MRLVRRHGHSVANGEEVIISSLEEGQDPKWGLSTIGSQQSDAAGEELLEKLGQFNPGKLLFVTSPFSRCVETAARVASHVDVHLHDERFRKEIALRERYFGEFNGGNTANYANVWAEDEKDTSSKPGGGESVEDVAHRLRSFVQGELEEAYKGCHIVLVSHGDSLSILLSILRGGDLRKHRENGMGNCEIVRVASEE